MIVGKLCLASCNTGENIKGMRCIKKGKRERAACLFAGAEGSQFMTYLKVKDRTSAASSPAAPASVAAALAQLSGSPTTVPKLSHSGVLESSAWCPRMAKLTCVVVGEEQERCSKTCRTCLSNSRQQPLHFSCMAVHLRFGCCCSSSPSTQFWRLRCIWAGNTS